MTQFTLDTPIFALDSNSGIKVDPNPIGTLRDVIKPSLYKEKCIIRGKAEYHEIVITILGDKREVYFHSTCIFTSSTHTWKKLKEFINSPEVDEFLNTLS